MNGITIFHSGLPVAFSTNGNDLSDYFGAGPSVQMSFPDAQRHGEARHRAEPTHGLMLTPNSEGGKGCFYDPGEFSFGNESRVDQT